MLVGGILLLKKYFKKEHNSYGDEPVGQIVLVAFGILMIITTTITLTACYFSNQGVLVTDEAFYNNNLQAYQMSVNDTSQPCSIPKK
jgi:hypothetical protein